MSTVLPVCTALILCDKVTDCPETGGNNLWGTFNKMQCSTPPTFARQFTIYVSLTEMHSSAEMYLEIWCNGPEGPLFKFRKPLTVESSGPLEILNVAIEMDGLPISTFGVHTVNLVHKVTGNILMLRPRRLADVHLK